MNKFYWRVNAKVCNNRFYYCLNYCQNLYKRKIQRKINSRRTNRSQTSKRERISIRKVKGAESCRVKKRLNIIKRRQLLMMNNRSCSIQEMTM